MYNHNVSGIRLTTTDYALLKRHLLGVLTPAEGGDALANSFVTFIIAQLKYGQTCVRAQSQQR